MLRLSKRLRQHYSQKVSMGDMSRPSNPSPPGQRPRIRINLRPRCNHRRPRPSSLRPLLCPRLLVLHMGCQFLALGLPKLKASRTRPRAVIPHLTIFPWRSSSQGREQACSSFHVLRRQRQHHPLQEVGACILKALLHLEARLVVPPLPRLATDSSLRLRSSHRRPWRERRAFSKSFQCRPSLDLRRGTVRVNRRRLRRPDLARLTADLLLHPCLLISYIHHLEQRLHLNTIPEASRQFLMPRN